MFLKAYLDDLPRGGVAAFAGAIGISSVYLLQLAVRQGGREPSPELCVRIEHSTHLKVRRWDMRPADWHLIWPELISLPGAPPLPTVAAQRGAVAADAPADVASKQQARGPAAADGEQVYTGPLRRATDLPQRA